MARKTENDFTEATKKDLRDRVANLCSNPECRKLTIAANLETSDKTTLIGEAAHICAASSGLGGARFNKNMTREEIKSINNGIWLCRNCHKKIDREPNAYTVKVLKNWKVEAEEFASERLGKSFNVESLDREWFKFQVENEIKDLGVRYSKKLNVEINDISNSFEALLRSESFEKVIFSVLNQIYEIFSDFKIDIGNDSEVVKSIDSILAELNSSWHKVLDKGVGDTSFFVVMKMVNSIGPQLNDLIANKNESYRYLTEDKIWELRDIIEEFEGVNFKLFNNPYLVVYGSAGVGKSHLLADLASSIISKNNKCILILGQKLNSLDNPWIQILRSELRLEYNEDRLLEILNDIGKRQKERCLIIIDALNEGQGRYFWNNSLAGFIEKFKRYPWVGLVVSVRTEYKDEILENIKPSIKNGEISEVLHEGFEHNVIEAVQEFYKHYDLPLPTEPVLEDEFKNPLFLKIYCEYRASKISNEYSINLITDVFDEYLRKINLKLSHVTMLNYRNKTNYVKKVLLKVAEEIYLKNGSQITYQEALELVISSYRVSDAENFLQMLLAEDLLLSYYDRTTETEYIYFAFERFLDFLTADNICNSINSATELSTVLTCDNLSLTFKDTNLSVGVISILAVLIPTKFKKEVFDVFPTQSQYMLSILGKAFIASLSWRSESNIDVVKSKIFIITHVFKDNDLFSDFIDLMYKIAGRENHPFNAKELHFWLEDMSMADRDAIWTVHISSRIYDTSSILSLIDWTKEASFSEQLSNSSRKLVGISLAWLFTTTNIKLRDSATQALVKLFKDNLLIAMEILELFIEVDDPYIIDRLFASVYGAVLISKQLKGLSNICNYLVERFFSKNEVYPNVLVRDYARNIVEHAQNKGIIRFNEKTLQSCRPPYKSKFPASLPTRKEIVEKYHPEGILEGDPKYRFVGSRIISSMTTEYAVGIGGYGDFGRYTFQAAFSNFDYLDVSKLSNYAVQLIFEQYGYSLEKHEDFDKYEAANGDRHTNTIERIGKKYQWIALYEVFARVSDNYKMIEPSTKYGEKVVKVWYDGALDTCLRDIDPTFMAPRKSDVKLITNPIYEDWSDDFESWSQSSENLIDPHNLILKSFDGDQWLSLEQHIEFAPKPNLGENIHSGNYQRVWYRVQAYLIKNDEFENVTLSLKDKSFMGNWMPQPAEEYYLFNLEYYWSPLLKMYDNPYYARYGWQDIKTDYNQSSLGKAYVCSEEHRWEGGRNSDLAYSVISPSQLVSEKLNLTNSEYAGAWLDPDNKVVLFDASLYGNDRANLLIRKDKLEELQEKTGCRVVWTILGEKTAMGKGRDGSNKRLEISGLYYYENGEIKGKQNFFIE
ncbi:HNH endonuclease [Psychrobacter sp. K31L]|uniref:HNH endonuclease n=1 Tax=Psychrobacter sp. K31L TaxID=2820758 RepID=UPI001B33705B|nr:HNH endonuclease [Psychrobacter sp. K31L]MBP3947145.1 HNH endonuclease [Psychrobacter sp. K31L]